MTGRRPRHPGGRGRGAVRGRLRFQQWSARVAPTDSVLVSRTGSGGVGLRYGDGTTGGEIAFSRGGGASPKGAGAASATGGAAGATTMPASGRSPPAGSARTASSPDRGACHSRPGACRRGARCSRPPRRGPIRNRTPDGARGRSASLPAPGRSGPNRERLPRPAPRAVRRSTPPVRRPLPLQLTNMRSHDICGVNDSASAPSNSSALEPAATS